MSQKNKSSDAKLHFSSSVADDVWHPRDEPSAYEWWYFDAVSDDGRDALVIIFLDNFIFSPRYNSVQSSKFKTQNSNPASEKFPAVVFCYYRDGKLLYRAINEFTGEEFTARTDFPACRIGASDFHFEATPYGIRYILNVNADLRGNLKINAALEWLIVERDFQPINERSSLSDAHYWNLSAPRSDVTGKITISDKNNESKELLQFRGTGYHDHNQDARWIPATIAEWQWGRAHFADVTAIFYRYREIGEVKPETLLLIVKDEKLSINNAVCSVAKFRRNRFGIKYPQTLEFLTKENFALSVKHTRTIDASFFYLRFLSEMRLDLGDGQTREVVGISEQLAPRSLRWRGLDWLVNMRIGRGGKGAFLP